jgi:hypothetical protein
MISDVCENSKHDETYCMFPSDHIHFHSECCVALINVVEHCNNTVLTECGLLVWRYQLL